MVAPVRGGRKPDATAAQGPGRRLRARDGAPGARDGGSRPGAHAQCPSGPGRVPARQHQELEGLEWAPRARMSAQ